MIQISIQLLKKHTNFLKNKGNIQEKVYRFPYNYSRNIQICNKIHEKIYKKLEYFIT